jgi:uncharacterized membrane protein YjjP (DUF1212 family)
MIHAVRPVLLGTADLSVGALLYHQVSAARSVLLLVAGMVVLCSVGDEALTHGGSVLWRRVKKASVSLT